MVRPFADAAPVYRDRGWHGVLWFESLHKHPPPSGYTGRNGRDPDDERIRRWIETGPDGNIGLRLPEDVLGIDVDAYDDKRGRETLEAADDRLGPLPPTWLSTSRTDGVSGIRWYRVQPNGRWRDRIPPHDSGIEIIQHRHRYAVVPPSIHPDTGTPYRWVDPDGNESPTPPRPEDLPTLPEVWQAFLHRDPNDPNAAAEPEHAGGTEDADVVPSLAGASSWFDLVRIYAERVIEGAARNDTGRDLALQLRDNNCPRGDAEHVFGPIYFQLLGERVHHLGADGEPYRPEEWRATVRSIYAGGRRREPLPGFAPAAGTAPGGRGPDAAAGTLRPGEGVAQENPDDRDAMLSDLGNSLRFTRRFRDEVRYVHGEDRWLVWDGIRWAPDTTNRVLDLTKLVVDDIRREAEDQDDAQLRDRYGAWALKSEGLQARRNMLGGAESEPGIALTPDQVDSDPYLLCALNGTIDLRTGELREHRPADLISRVVTVAYDPEVWTSPLLDQFCATFMPDREELGYVFKSLGYGLLGGNPNRLLYIIIGHTTSGKSQFMEAVAATLGPYAIPVGTSVFRANLDDKPRPDLIRALPARLAYAEEASHNWELHTDMVKRITGGSMVVVRGMRSNTMIERIPSFTPLIVTNEMPRIRGADQAVKRRMIVLRFGHPLDPAREDPEIKTRFVADELTRQALLTQLVAGALRMGNEGWRELPINFEWAKQEAFAELSHLGDFLQYMRDTQQLIEGDDTIPLTNCWKHADLHLIYGEWIKEHGDAEDRRTKLGWKDFGKALRELGWVSKTSAGTRWMGKYNPASTLTWANPQL